MNQKTAAAAAAAPDIPPTRSKSTFMDNKANLTTPEEDRMVDEAFRDMLNGYLASNHRKKVEIIERAYRFA